jgi:type IV fimbrial biogenesis protein FimT
VEFTLGVGTAWTVTVAGTGDMVQQRYASDGSANITVATTGGTKVTFNGLGRVVPTNADGSNPMTRALLDSNALALSDSRELRIDIESGGTIRMCDPAVNTAGDPRICPP